MEIKRKKFIELIADENKIFFELNEDEEEVEIGRNVCFMINEDEDEQEYISRYIEKEIVEDKKEKDILE